MSLTSEDILISFKKSINNDIAIPIAAMHALTQVIKQSTSSTWFGLSDELRIAINILKSCNINDLGGRTSISLTSGCDLFMKYVSRAFNTNESKVHYYNTLIIIKYLY